ncbi:MAG: precorrin-3B C(17)-methyltransferase [Deltaproteobacteria bacterium]|nr:precorrin-3B C(17)-methyltransferase [Deltaproteobacteria bacterium]MBW2087656.1 precorrin-3B C(17)-methyltransferase [Deltaproteobacteria bacterium]
MRSRSNSCVKQRKADRSQALNPERDHRHSKKILYVIGIGPGSPDYLSKRVYDIFKTVDAVAGYTTYIDLIRPLVKDKHVISSAMTREIERVQAAIDIALSGKSCAIVSSGDPGIYAMAGLVLEICKMRKINVVTPYSRETALREKATLAVEIVPGIPALCSGASLLGAPLNHDFAAISLSDLLTSWERIEQRIEAAAKADFVIVLYNPKSKRRQRHLETAQKIILKYRDKNTPVGIVVNAMRKGQDVRIVPLKNLHEATVNMQTTVFIGSSTSFEYIDFMITPRGYGGKYSGDIL